MSVTIKEMFNVQENPIFVKRDGNKEILSLFKTHDFGGRMESRKNTKVWDFYWHSLEKIKNYSPKRQNIMDFTVEKFNVATSSNTDREERILFSGENTDREERILLIKDLDTHDI